MSGLTDAERETLAELAELLSCSQCGKRFTQRACGPAHAIIASDPRRHRVIEQIIATREDALREEIAKQVEAIRISCPIHHVPDCSPLRNGCSQVNWAYRAIRDAARIARGQA